MSLALGRLPAHRSVVARVPRWSALGGNLRDTEFPKFWAGQTVSGLGSQITMLALPLIVVGLNASASQMGILRAMQFLPFLLLGLPAGVWIDRVRRRPLLMAADLGRAALLLSLPLAAALGGLRLEHVFAVAFATGALTVVFDVAQQAFVPALVRRDHLMEANEKLEVSRCLGQTLGPGLGGLLVQIVTAPFTILLDAVSFVFSAMMLRSVRGVEPPVATAAGNRSLRAEIAEGLSIVAHQPLLRSLAGCSATLNLFNNALYAVLLLYLARDLRVEPSVMGLVVAAVGPGGVIGALLASRLARLLGIGPTIVLAVILAGLSAAFVLPASPDQPLLLPLVSTSLFLSGLSGPIYNVNSVSLRQAITPDRLRGRVTASLRFVIWGTMPIGALLGGFLGEAIGLRPTLALAAIGMLLASLWVLFSPVARLRTVPTTLLSV
jgi:MFS family permease